MIELVLTGAGDGTGTGLKRYLKQHSPDRETTIVLGIAACAEGTPRWWSSDGPLLPLRSTPALRGLCERIAARDPEIGAAPHRGRGAAPALPARIAGIPAISIGCLAADGPPRATHRPDDTLDAVDPAAVDRAIEFGLLLIDAIDAHFARTANAGSAAHSPSATR